MKLAELISKDLSLPMDFVNKALQDSQFKIKIFTIKKSDGGERLITHPPKTLKVLQYWLIHNIFSKLMIDDASTAYKRGASIRENAERHKNSKYFLKVDFKDFFPSIRSDDLHLILKVWHAKQRPNWEWNNENLELIKKSCFDNKNRLPIGFPSSPIICNAVMSEFDRTLKEKFNSRISELGEVIYTRYADDMFFSTNVRHACDAIFKTVKSHVSECPSPKLRINPKKTKFSSKSGGSAFVTGIRICSDCHLTLHKKYKDHVRLQLSLFQKGRLPKEEMVSLRGSLAYIMSTDPTFYTKLQRKHFRSIETLINS